MTWHVPTNNPKDTLGRFQFQPWYVKTWRCRHLLAVPLIAASIWYRGYQPWGYYYRYQLGMAMVKMNWVYDMDEAIERAKKKGFL